jgi:arginase family enzyme
MTTPGVAAHGAVGFMNAIKAMPARTASFAGYAGPVALFGAATLGTQAAQIGMAAARKHGRTDTDVYSRVEWRTDMSEAVVKPPNSTTFMPTIDCGVMTPGEGESASTVNDALRATTAMLTEKGIIPVCIGDSADALVPMIEGLRQVTGEEYFLYHLGGNTLMDTEDAPLTQIFRRGLNRNCLSLGNRGVTAHARQVRKQHEVRYGDYPALAWKGLFTVKDVRNQYPGFVVIDIGALDPAFAPGVATPESGGMTTRDLLHLIAALRGTRVMGVLITGFEPKYDVLRGRGDDAVPEDGLTALAMSKVTKEIINKCYSMSVQTTAEGHDLVRQMVSQGKAPEKFPE